MRLRARNPAVLDAFEKIIDNAPLVFRNLVEFLVLGFLLAFRDDDLGGFDGIFFSLAMNHVLHTILDGFDDGLSIDDAVRNRVANSASAFAFAALSFKPWHEIEFR